MGTGDIDRPELRVRVVCDAPSLRVLRSRWSSDCQAGSLEEPYITDAEAIQFARDARFNRSMTINFTDYRQQLEDVRGDWTKRGFAQYLEQLRNQQAIWTSSNPSV